MNYENWYKNNIWLENVVPTVVERLVAATVTLIAVGTIVTAAGAWIMLNKVRPSS